MIETDRRNSPRTEVKWPIVLTNQDGAVEGETLNISRDGISFCSDDPVTYKEKYKVRILPPDHGEIQAVGQVTWSSLYGMDENAKTYCMGVCFIELQDADQGWINSLSQDGLA